MAEGYLLDTCAFTKAAREVPEVKALAGPPPWLVSSVTVWELRRGLLKWSLQGNETRTAAELRMRAFAGMFVAMGPEGADDPVWQLAAELWADAAVRKPAVVFGVEDLLIYATARTAGRTLLTLDARLAALLKQLGEVSFHLVKVAKARTK